MSASVPRLLAASTTSLLEHLLRQSPQPERRKTGVAAQGLSALGRCACTTLFNNGFFRTLLHTLSRLAALDGDERQQQARGSASRSPGLA